MPPLERTGAVDERRGDLDADRHLRWLALRLADDGEHVGVDGHPGIALDPQRLVATGDDEQQPDVRVLDDVGEAVDEVVADGVREHHAALVEHLHEAGHAALGDTVSGPPLGRGQEQNRQAAMNAAVGLDDAVRLLVGDELARLPEQLLQAGPSGRRRGTALVTTGPSAGRSPAARAWPA